MTTHVILRKINGSYEWIIPPELILNGDDIRMIIENIPIDNTNQTFFPIPISGDRNIMLHVLVVDQPGTSRLMLPTCIGYKQAIGAVWTINGINGLVCERSTYFCFLCGREDLNARDLETHCITLINHKPSVCIRVEEANGFYNYQERQIML
jgi:hypothetical protein